MKKVAILSVGAALLLSSCGSYAGAGAYTGSSLGSILGSAIGGITGGPRGADIGTIVGMAGGAVVGGAIGSKADQKAEDRRQQYYDDQRDDLHDHYQKVMANRETRRGNGYDTGSGFDASGSGDDRLYDFGGSDYNGDYSASSARVEIPSTGNYHYAKTIEIRNARFVDDDMDNTLSRGEMSKIIFEVFNRSNETMYDVVPVVEETAGNKHIYISPSVHVEQIAPGKGVRYTALVKADKSLKNGEANFRIYVVQDNRNVSSHQLFTVKTRK